MTLSLLPMLRLPMLLLLPAADLTCPAGAVAAVPGSLTVGTAVPRVQQVQVVLIPLPALTPAAAKQPAAGTAAPGNAHAMCWLTTPAEKCEGVLALLHCWSWQSCSAAALCSMQSPHVEVPGATKDCVRQIPLIKTEVLI